MVLLSSFYKVVVVVVVKSGALVTQIEKYIKKIYTVISSDISGIFHVSMSLS